MSTNLNVQRALPVIDDTSKLQSGRHTKSKTEMAIPLMISQTKHRNIVFDMATPKIHMPDVNAA